MIITRTPYRVSFFGGGTDYPSWIDRHGGAVLGMAINKYCYITCRYLPPFFDHRYRIVYSQIENRTAIEEIQHPAVRACLQYCGVDRGVEIHHDGDLPARSGMGSSSSFTVGLLNALHALAGKMPSWHQLAEESIHLEQDVLSEAVGCQDQIFAAYGGLNAVYFSKGGRYETVPITIPHDRLSELNSHLVLTFSGVKRTASNIARTYSESVESQERTLHRMREMVDEGIKILEGGDIRHFGKLLREAWEAKRSLSHQVSNDHIQDLFDSALDAGAIGGKLLGAGGGGFMLFFVPPERQKRFRERLRNLVHVPFKPEFSGSRVMVHTPEEDFAAQELEREVGHLNPFVELEQLRATGNVSAF